MTERSFLIFFFFCYFFRIFLPGSGRNGIIRIFFCSLSFSTYLNPVWIEIMPTWSFFNFLTFFAIFFRIFLPGSSRNRIRDKIFFLCFAAYLKPVWTEIIPEWCFLIFWIFFFWNFLDLVGQERNSGRKFFFSLSRPISTRFGLK